MIPFLYATTTTANDNYTRETLRKTDREKERERSRGGIEALLIAAIRTTFIKIKFLIRNKLAKAGYAETEKKLLLT